MMCRIEVDLSEACKEYGYNNGKPCKLVGTILPCKYLKDVLVNGKLTNVINFYEVSPLYQAAEIKNGQILTYEKKILNVPEISNTVYNITVKGYIWQRILEITEHNLEPVMLISTILESNNLTDISRKAKSKLIKDIEEMLNYWLKEKIFVGYSLQDRKGDILRGKKYQRVIYKIEILRKKNKNKTTQKTKNKKS